MKKFIFLLSLVALMTLTPSCKKDDVTPDDPPIVVTYNQPDEYMGSWKSELVQLIFEKGKLTSLKLFDGVWMENPKYKNWEVKSDSLYFYDKDGKVTYTLTINKAPDSSGDMILDNVHFQKQ